MERSMGNRNLKVLEEFNKNKFPICYEHRP